MTMLAMWILGADPISAVNTKLLIVFIGVVALALLVQALALVWVAIKSANAITVMVQTVDELKQKSLPLIDAATSISLTTEALLHENAPKVRTIADNLVQTSDTLVEASKVARSTVEQIGYTVADANQRTQRQVARVDNMVSTALNATVEVVETVVNGIRVPTQKIAAMTCQAKHLVEGLLAKIKSVAAKTPFASR
jgi:uncharacterized protein YoxC